MKNGENNEWSLRRIKSVQLTGKHKEKILNAYMCKTNYKIVQVETEW